MGGDATGPGGPGGSGAIPAPGHDARLSAGSPPPFETIAPDDVARLLRLIGLVYDAATDFDRWQPFLEALAEEIGADGSQVTHFDLGEERYDFCLMHGLGQPRSDEEARRFLQLSLNDPMAQHGLAHRGVILNCRNFGDDVIRNSAVYREILVPHGVAYRLAVLLRDENSRAGSSVGLRRGPKRDPFGTREENMLQALVPHLQRAMYLHKRLANLNARQAAAFSALDTVATAMLIVERSGRLLFANRSAGAIADAADGLLLDTDTFRTYRPEDRAAILAATRQRIDAARTGIPMPTEFCSIRRPNLGTPLHAVVSTIWNNQKRFGAGFLDDPLGVIFVSDPDATPEIPAEDLRRIFGLTPREAELVALLAAGRRLAEAATELEVTVGTARQHLKSVFSKTGTNGQPELIGLVTRTAMWNREAATNGKT